MKIPMHPLYVTSIVAFLLSAVLCAAAVACELQARRHRERADWLHRLRTNPTLGPQLPPSLASQLASSSPPSNARRRSSSSSTHLRRGSSVGVVGTSFTSAYARPVITAYGQTSLAVQQRNVLRLSTADLCAQHVAPVVPAHVVTYGELEVVPLE